MEFKVISNMLGLELSSALEYSYTNTLCNVSGGPIEMQIRLRSARETISVICTLTISNKIVNIKLFNNVIFV